MASADQGSDSFRVPPELSARVPVRETLSLDSLVLDAGTQVRAAINSKVVDDYVADLEQGDRFPPVVVFRGEGRDLLSDGFHRVHAYRKAGRSEIDADVRPGPSTMRCGLRWAPIAVTGSASSAATSATRSSSPTALGRTPVCRIADHVGCVHQYVARVRAQLSTSGQLPVALSAPTVGLAPPRVRFVLPIMLVVARMFAFVVNCPLVDEPREFSCRRKSTSRCRLNGRRSDSPAQIACTQDRREHSPTMRAGRLRAGAGAKTAGVPPGPASAQRRAYCRRVRLVLRLLARRVVELAISRQPRNHVRYVRVRQLCITRSGLSRRVQLPSWSDPPADGGHATVGSEPLAGSDSLEVAGPWTDATPATLVSFRFYRVQPARACWL